MPEGKSTLQRDLCELEERPTATSGGPARPNAKPCRWDTLSPSMGTVPDAVLGTALLGRPRGKERLREQGLLVDRRQLWGDLKAAPQY